MAACLVTLLGAWLSAESLAQAPDRTNALVGAWTLNKDLSDQPQTTGDTGEAGPGGGGSPGGGGGGFGRRGRGLGGGGRNGGFGGANAPANPDAVARIRDAMRDIVNPPGHLTIVSTETTIVLTGPDGRTTRLSSDGKKVKDENTNIERKTKWDGDKLVSEINGLGPGKVTETYSVDPERHQLHITAQMEGGRGGQPRTISHVYDLDAR